MIKELFIYSSEGTDPYRNLAQEERLLACADGCCILYLWQNADTVVIGRNQNPWRECRIGALEEDGGHLARRLSGGGAVFHDLGNLNFTFLMPDADYDINRQTEVLRRACASLGIEAERSGRNDLLCRGRKFSGNAFFHHAGRAYHHGTILIDADTERMGRYLRPSAAKLRAKGVESVRSRVINLREINGGLRTEDMENALAAAFAEVYGLRARDLDSDCLSGTELDALVEKYRSWDWNFGTSKDFDFAAERRFDWGELRAEISVDAGVIRTVYVSTDAMDWTVVPRLERALTGCRLEREHVFARVRGELPELGDELCAMLEEQIM